MNSARTRILCTLGPASRDVQGIRRLIEAGADGLRLNGAHVRPLEVAAWVRRIRQASRLAGQPAAILLDLPGTKLRVGPLHSSQGLTLVEGQRVALVKGPRAKRPDEIPVRPFAPLKGARAGTRVLLDDGRMELVVTAATREGWWAEVRRGGQLLAGKGVDVTGAALTLTVPTPGDRALAAAGVAAGVDLLALSFVRRGAEVRALRRLLTRAGHPDLPIVAKIERVQACENLGDILEEADAALVARGDLGVDAGPERVPGLQRRIIQAANGVGRPVLLATELLESMIERSRPTRAEVSDVAHAVLQGVDAVMLSSETAIGHDPELVVRTLNSVLLEAERDPLAPYAGLGRTSALDLVSGGDDAHVARAAVELATRAGAFAIAVYTRSGATAIRLSKERPRARIRAFVPTDAVVRRLVMAWGVTPERLRTRGSALIGAISERLRADPDYSPGRPAVLVMGGPDDPLGSTRVIRLLQLNR